MTNYRDVVGFPHYRVGDDGSVWSCRKKGQSRPGTEWVRLKTQIFNGKRSDGGNRLPYERVYLYRDGKRHSLLVHRLVLEAFIGPCPDGMEARHHDGVAFHNWLGNLSWGTPIQNAADKVAHGTFGPGSLNGRAVLTESLVLAIRQRASVGESRYSMAAEYGVTYDAITDVVLRRNWKHVA